MAKNCGEMTIDGSELLSRIHITVRMPRLISVRLWLGAKLMLIGGWVSGTTVSIEVAD